VIWDAVYFTVAAMEFCRATAYHIVSRVLGSGRINVIQRKVARKRDRCGGEASLINKA
jgi:hypothetical protein